MCTRLGLVSKGWKILILELSLWNFYEKYEKMGIAITKHKNSWPHTYHFLNLKSSRNKFIFNNLLLNWWFPQINSIQVSGHLK